MNQLLKKETGSFLIETALALVILIVLAKGIISYGMHLNIRTDAQQISKELLNRSYRECHVLFHGDKQSNSQEIRSIEEIQEDIFNGGSQVSLQANIELNNRIARLETCLQEQVLFFYDNSPYENESLQLIIQYWSKTIFDTNIQNYVSYQTSCNPADPLGIPPRPGYQKCSISQPQFTLSSINNDYNDYINITSGFLTAEVYIDNKAPWGNIITGIGFFNKPIYASSFF